MFGFIAITVFAALCGKIVISKFSWNNNEELSHTVGHWPEFQLNFGDLSVLGCDTM